MEKKIQKVIDFLHMLSSEEGVVIEVQLINQKTHYTLASMVIFSKVLLENTIFSKKLKKNKLIKVSKKRLSEVTKNFLLKEESYNTLEYLNTTPMEVIKLFLWTSYSKSKQVKQRS